jgi:hypothetical protein
MLRPDIVLDGESARGVFRAMEQCGLEVREFKNAPPTALKSPFFEGKLQTIYSVDRKFSFFRDSKPCANADL